MNNTLAVRYITEPALPIETLVQQIEVRANKSDDHSIAAALMLVELRGRVESGELGPDVKWMEWAIHNIRLSPSRLAELLAVGEAQDPHAEIERLRRMNRERQKAFRERQQAEKTQRAALEDEREDIIKWAHEGKMDHVRKIRECIISLELKGCIPLAAPKTSKKKQAAKKAGAA